MVLRHTLPTLLHHFVEDCADRHPDKEAIVFGSERMSYRQLEQQVNRLAHVLMDSGVRRGDRVVVFLDNSIETVVSLFGVLKAGAAFSVISTQTKSRKFEFIINDCRPSAVILHGKYQEQLEVCRSCPHVRAMLTVGDGANSSNCQSKLELDWDTVMRRQAAQRAGAECVDLDLASIIYTSGTTGNPKGVMHTHRSMISASTSITTYLQNVPEDRIINMLPMSFDYGLYQAIMSVQMGATLVLERSFAYPYVICETVRRERVTGFPGVPTIFAMLLAMEPGPHEHLESVRYVSNTGAALPASHITAMKDLFRNARIYSMYGVTECKRVSYMPPEELEARPTSVGKGMPNEEVWIVKDNGEPAGAGEVGELVVRGSNVMLGYWERPEESAAVLKAGRYPGERVLHTGDLFRMDEEGYLYFVSRQDEIIKSRGEKVSPKEVEDVIYEVPGVFEALVVGVDDEILGQAIKAYIVPRDGQQLDAKQIKRHCLQHLENFMVPKSIEFVEGLPKTSSGKISRREVMARSGERAAT